MSDRAPHWEIARTPSGWTTRLVANGRTILSSGAQCYSRRAGAVRAADIADPEQRMARVDKDERTPPPAPLVAEPPYYLGHVFNGDDFWHDRDYHWRFCYGDECTRGEPPSGAEIKVRGGSVVQS